MNTFNEFAVNHNTQEEDVAIAASSKVSRNIEKRYPGNVTVFYAWSADGKYIEAVGRDADMGLNIEFTVSNRGDKWLVFADAGEATFCFTVDSEVMNKELDKLPNS